MKSNNVFKIGDSKSEFPRVHEVKKRKYCDVIETGVYYNGDFQNIIERSISVLKFLDKAETRSKNSSGPTVDWDIFQNSCVKYREEIPILKHITSISQVFALYQAFLMNTHTGKFWDGTKRLTFVDCVDLLEKVFADKEILKKLIK